MTLNRVFDLPGKTALVTRCNRGIGKAARRHLHPHQVDLANRENLYYFVSLVKEEHKSIDILINNAGIILRQRAAEHSGAYRAQVMRIPARRWGTPEDFKRPGCVSRIRCIQIM